MLKGANSHWDYRGQPKLADPVEVVPYDVAWVQLFEAEREKIHEILGSEILNIEHIGSTSVPGLLSKPVIDILVRVRKYPLTEEHLAGLGALGYQYRGEEGLTDGQFFRTDPRTRHLRALAEDSPGWEQRISFRDYLRRHPAVRDKYAFLKSGLSEQFRHDRATYTEAKTRFILEVLAQLKESR